MKEIRASVAILAALAAMSLGVVSATPSQQSGDEQSSFTLLKSVLSEAYAIGQLPDALSDLLSDLLIEYLVTPHTGETTEQVSARLCPGTGDLSASPVRSRRGKRPRGTPRCPERPTVGPVH